MRSEEPEAVLIAVYKLTNWTKTSVFIGDDLPTAEASDAGTAR